MNPKSRRLNHDPLLFWAIYIVQNRLRSFTGPHLLYSPFVTHLIVPFALFEMVNLPFIATALAAIALAAPAPETLVYLEARQQCTGASCQIAALARSSGEAPPTTLPPG